MDIGHKKTIYFVRHGQSLDNISPVYQSSTTPLSKQGKKQALAIANRLQNVEFETIISSPLNRARETAEQIAAKTHKKIEFSNLFVERIKPREIEGKPWKDENATKLWREWQLTTYDGSKRFGDGENYNDIIKRVDNALSFLLNKPESKIVVVTHGYFLRSIVARVLIGNQLTGTIFQHFQERASVENTAITILHYKNDFEKDYAWRLWTLNDHSHFTE